MDDNMEGGAWSGGGGGGRAIAMMACSFLQVEEMYPDQEKHLEHF